MGMLTLINFFFISQMIKGYSNINTCLDSRLPITLPLLHRLVLSASSLSESKYNIALFQAMCLFTFHTFSKIREITSSPSNHTIQFD